MIIKYLSFLIGIVWSYSIIKTQSVFSKKAGLIFKVLISKVSWLVILDIKTFQFNTQLLVSLLE